MKNKSLPIVVIALLSGAAVSRADTNIAVIDVARVFEEYLMTRDLESRFEESRRGMSSRAEEKRTRIEQMRRSLKAFDPASDDFAQREQEVMRAEMEYQFWTAQREKELKGEHKRWLMKVYRNTQSTIAVIAERRDISLVLTYDRLADDAPDSMTLRQQILLQKVIYHDARVDITDEVLELLNTAYRNDGGLRSVNLPAGRLNGTQRFGGTEPMTESLTLEGLAALVDGELHGNGQIVIRGVATLHAAGPDEVTWVNSAQRLEALAQCKAGAVLLGKDMAVPDRPAVVCADVDHAVAQLLTSFGPAPDRPATGVHPTALVDPSAEVSPEASIGPGVVIEARARIGAGSVLHACVVIGANTIIGQDCQLWPHVVVRERCVLGNRVVLHSGTVIGADGFGYYLRDGQHHKIPHNGGVVIEDDVEIGACCCVDRSKTGNTRIGTGTKVDNLVQVGHNVQIGAHNLVCAQAGLAGSSRLGSYVVLGGQVGIRDNIVLHDHVMVGACSCVAGDVEAGQRVTGTPAAEARSFMRQIRLSRKLPDLVAKVNALLKRVEELEAAADHSSNG